VSKSVVKTVRLPTGLSNHIEDLAHCHGVTNNAMLKECIRRGAITMKFIPFYRVKSTAQIALLAAALANNNQIVDEIEND
jgi:hypothetical protein